MKSVSAILVSIAGLQALHVVLGKTIFNSKKEDRYKTAKNNISNGAPILPIEGGYKHPEDFLGRRPGEEIENVYDMRSFYDMGNGHDMGSPYYYYIYDPRAIYDPESSYYIGSEFDLTKPYHAEFDTNSYVFSRDVSDGTANSETYDDQETHNDPGTHDEPERETLQDSENPQDREVYVQTEEPSGTSDIKMPDQHEEDHEMGKKESRPVPYWIPSEMVGNPRTENSHNPYTMIRSLLLQSFPMFNPDYYQSEYEDYQRITAENEKKRGELDEQLLEANTVDNPAKFPRGGRVKRGFARMLNLRGRTGDGPVHVSGKGVSGKSENVVLNANCRGGTGGRRPSPGNNGGNSGGTPGVDDVGSGIAEAAETAQNGAGEVAGAAGDAVDAAADAVENLRLASGRRTNTRRNGNNRNNGRGVE